MIRIRRRLALAALAMPCVVPRAAHATWSLVVLDHQHQWVGVARPLEGDCPAAAVPYFEFQVDVAASFILADSTRPRPVTSGVHAARPEFLAQFVVDTSGFVRPGTLKFLRYPGAAAADSARAASARWRFRPARLGGCTVVQLVQVELER